MLALEGSHGIDADVWALHTLFRLRVRVASFAHWNRTALADGSGEDATGGRLTGAGVEAFRLCEELGILFDVSHLSASGVAHVLELATRPVMATHSSARAVRDHHRNLTDEQAKGIAATGGVVCVNFFPGFVDPEVRTVDRLVDHIDHLVGLLGVGHVGIGPDFIREVEEELAPGVEELWFEGLDVKWVLPVSRVPRACRW